MGRGEGGRILHAGEVALTPEEVGFLLSKIDNDRDLALLSLAVTTGIRRADIVKLRVEDFDPDRGSLRFYETKKRRNRTVPVDPTAAMEVVRWLKGRRMSSVWLFPSPKKPRLPISSRHAWDVLNRWLEVAGLPKRPFHSLRATCYKLAKAKGWGVEKAAALIGDSIRVAQEVYGVATTGELLEVSRSLPLL